MLDHMKIYYITKSFRRRTTLPNSRVIGKKSLIYYKIFKQSIKTNKFLEFLIGLRDSISLDLKKLLLYNLLSQKLKSLESTVQKSR
jgi:hypothetical protein